MKMRSKFSNYLLLVLILCTAAAAWIFEPRSYIADSHTAVELETVIPSQFGEWQEMKQVAGLIVNPQLQEKLDTLYSQILTRSYVNAKGQRVMLSIAYGRDQRSYMAVHYPEVCYPAQGFSLLSNRLGTIDFNGRPYAVRQLETQLGKQRYEPVTYWTTIGEYRSLGGFKKRLLELQYGFAGEIPDGLLFRVSSIGTDTPNQLALQQQFISALLNEVTPKQRTFLTGARDL
jgi:EpsI family protein